MRKTPHLPFRSLIGTLAVSISAAGPLPGALLLEYTFGKLVPGGDYGRAPAEPKAVVVREDRGRTVIRPSKYVQQVGGIRMEISPAALNHP